MTQAIQIMQQSIYDMTNEYNLIPENKSQEQVQESRTCWL
jgi:hypothetical protein